MKNILFDDHKRSIADLNIMLNSWPEGCLGWERDKKVLMTLDHLGNEIGYGALQQFATWLRDIQCYGKPKEACDLKRERFTALGWKLPERFEEVAQ